MTERAKEIAAAFRKMADDIERNIEAPFGGAFVVVPPEDGGDMLSTLILDNRQDATQFWIFLKTKSEFEVSVVDEKKRQVQAFGRPR